MRARLLLPRPLLTPCPTPHHPVLLPIIRNAFLAGWRSDVIVDLIKHYDFPYIALNPGASYRGLHDSLVNYGGNQPPILLCQHEKIAVQIAHGYAKATGKPMVAIVHDVVGLLPIMRGNPLPVSSLF